MKDLVIVRHGQAVHETRGLTGGWTDTSLTGIGRWQAGKAGEAVARLLRPPYAFYSSDLIRAWQTAGIMADRLVGPPMATALLRELNNGVARGRKLDQAKAEMSPMSCAYLDWTPWSDSESWRDFYSRIHGFLDGVVLEAERVVLVTHGHVATAAVHWWLGLPEDRWMDVAYQFDNASITHLSEGDKGEHKVLCLNDTAHLTS